MHLKSCPKYIRSNNSKDANDTTMNSDHSSTQRNDQSSPQQPPTPPPVGTHLKLVDDDHFLDVNGSPARDQSNNIQIQPPHIYGD